jgi:USP8 interacting
MKHFFFLFLLLSPALLFAQERGDQAYIVKPGSFYTTYNFETADETQITRAVGKDEFNNINATCHESDGWPSGISNLTSFFDNEEAIKKYTAYFVCRFGDGKVILRIPQGPNSSMPSQLRPSKTIHFIVGEDGVDFDSPATTTQSSTANSFESATVTNFGDLYSTYNFGGDELRRIASEVGQSMADDIEVYANESSWPSGISGFDDRQTNRPKMYNYNLEHVYTLGDKAILRAAKANNGHMVGNMKLTHDIYFVVNESSVDVSGSGSGKRTQEKSDLSLGDAVTVTDFGDLYSTYDFEDTDSKQIIDAVGRPDYTLIKEFSREDAWPKAISGFSDRQTNRPKMYNYNVEFVCTFGAGSNYAIIKAPVSKNKHMVGDFKLVNDIYFVIAAKSIEAN